MQKPLIGRRSWRARSLDHQRRGVDADRHRDGPVGRHLRVLVVETFQLQLQVRPATPTPAVTTEHVTHDLLAVCPS